MIMIDSLFNKYRDRLVLEDVETRLATIERKSFNTDTSIPTEEIFDVATAAPGVIAAYVTVVRPAVSGMVRGPRMECEPLGHLYIHQYRVRS